MLKPVYIVDEIGNVVTKVSTALLASLQLVDPNITGVQYYFGHYKEILETLQQKDGTSLEFSKYPAVCLFMDFPETTGKAPGIAAEVKLQMIIAYATDPNLKAAERYTKSFKPVLYPIYNSFIDELMRSGRIMAPSKELISHTKIDRLYWGRKGLFGNTGNVFNDYLDAIEIKDLNLKFYKPAC